ncbi:MULTISPECIES: glucose-6-phosphate isomerase [Thermodesulfovibrio]|uniref:Glucose-6-phosphate isomerase n=1 Tax=Thermodesulfovibrio yellowstonii (strain ATCC 51303 / DSM 11347 / YP87) TaxID=289376 RepID=B5YHI1_THEYD|nr:MULTISPECIES: glucose-6-phosphate isomerase [Thermodesulfovibrio]ACI21789.1 glucose-6-phosphate isomerase [Thermodesulfovibrio yellowstonii DSM 11347]
MIRLDFSNILTEEIGHNGLSLIEIENEAKKSISLLSKKPYKELDFINLPFQDTSQIKELAKKARDYEYFIVLGIGGSALGPRVLLEALSPFNNLRKKNRVFIYDNVDPATFKYIIEIIDLKKTLINVISKSGSTAETLASFLLFWRMIRDRKLDVRQHFIFTTDSEKGNLKMIADEYEIPSLEIPKNVVGRYSVLTPVGLLLSEVIGIKSEELLEGAKEISERAYRENLNENPMAYLASCLYLMDKLKNRKVLVFLPYSDRLKTMSEWFCQLWAESLGKEGKGTTPYPSLGTTDQHSQLQLWMEGPEDKVILFVSIDNHGFQEEIPQEFHDIEGLRYLGGHTLEELINTEQLATEMALRMNKKPNMKIIIPKIDSFIIGQLFQFLQITTAMAGLLYGVNPFNQPGVELGKRLTYGAMGKRGFETEGEEVKNYLKRQRYMI